MDTLLGRRYRLDAEIARGAAGAVWRGVERATGTPVAVKLPIDGADLLTEAEILTVLDHPAVVRLRDLVALEYGYAIVLDLVHGLDLRRRLGTDGPAPPAVAAELIAQVAEVLAYLHGRGVVHADVKPGNILVPADGGPARLTDFGLARRVAETAPPTHATPEYVAPEVVGGAAAGPAADVYGLGITLYELLCGRSPYRGGSAVEVMLRHVTCTPVRPAGVPDAVWAVVADCLRTDPAVRPPAAQVAARLCAAVPALAGYPPAPALPDGAMTWAAPADRIRRPSRLRRAPRPRRLAA